MSTCNLYYEILKLGSHLETHTTDKINHHLSIAQTLREKIDLLLSASQALTKGPNDQLSQDAESLLAKLHLLPQGPINKEKLSEIKSEISGQIDQHRSQISSILTTKVGHLAQVVLNQLYDMMKKVAQESQTACSRINERMSRG